MDNEVPIRVLVTGASGDSAQGVIRALREASVDYFIAAVCIHRCNVGFLMSDASAVAPLSSQEGEYVQFLMNFMKEKKIDVLIPTVDSELTMLGRRCVEIEQKTGAKVIIGSHQSVLTCCDKDLTAKYLDKVGVCQPVMLRGGFAEVRWNIEEGTPVVMKPRTGGGSRGIRVLRLEDLDNDDWMVENYIYQIYEKYRKEFTSVVMKDGANVAAIAVFERTLHEGRTTWCQRVPSSPFEAMLEAVASDLDVPYLNIQFGQVGLQYQVFDINPRFSGSTAVFAQVFNGPDLLVRRIVSGTMPAFNPSTRYFESMRYLADFFVDKELNV